MKDGVKRFHEQDTEVKKQFYTRDSSKPVVYDSNFDLYSAPSANWRDTLSLISNDRFKNGEHRVLANGVGPRISVATFFYTGMLETKKLYGPIKELLSDANRPKYRETTVRDFIAAFQGKGLGGTSALANFKI
ncbi:hypothetical protein FNV43_RR01484 [Rhamnella rubrinervis]|uniref:Uncharacterized protein n=1 Tax=Rhamnella rubrinervis TaxID=2594499 RepID=A0A8K0MTC8_9ROSA|nr:hypothetical protein FNV43_RR01484 [Rhamnella rubrinervis]